MAGGSFSPGDYAWGQNGLDDIITQVHTVLKMAFVQSLCDIMTKWLIQLLQTVEGGAPPASRDDVQSLKPEPFQQYMRDKNSQVCSNLKASKINYGLLVFCLFDWFWN